MDSREKPSASTSGVGAGGGKGSQGILRVDASKSHRIAVQTVGEPSSPQPSVDRLSVSFAPDYGWPGEQQPPASPTAFGESGGKPASDASVKVNLFNMSAIDGNGLPSPGGGSATSPPAAATLGAGPTRLSANLTDEEDDYSASMNVILQRRASQRKVKGMGKRRTSSPYDSDRRRSSVFTTSSGETAITMEGGDAATQEQIFENIRLHKELLDSVKQQPWDMRRKLKLIQQAKEYVKRHEGQLQERLAQSKSTKDVIARFKLLLIRFWQHFKRELSNLIANMVPWEQRIKEIESHFGSVVASYFTFLRWVFWINIVISAILICFVMVPEILAADKSKAGQRKILLPSEERTAAHLGTLWEFEGLLKHSPLFYGYYTDQKKTKEGYPLPLFYFITGLGVYIYSFVTILRRMAANSRLSKLSDKEDECAFSWRLFTAWDYMIGNPETALNRFASIIMGFKEALLEEKEKTKDERNWKVISLRVFANFLILLLLMFSAFAVVKVVERSEVAKPDDSWWRQNEITLTLSLITTIFPNIFELVGMLENYHPRKQLRWQLARIMVLNFLNLYTLIFALFGKVASMTEELQGIKHNQTALTSTTPTSYYSTTEAPFCNDVVVNCTILEEYASYEAIKETRAVLVFVANLTTLLPSSSGDYQSTAANFPFLNGTSTASGTFNMSEWWQMVHNLTPRTDLAQIFGSNGNITSGGSTSADFSSETWSEYLDSENYTFWTNQSSIDLNETQGPWVPENRTALVSAFPIIIKIINAYLATLIPTLSKTTPFVGDFSASTSHAGFMNVTIDPQGQSSPTGNVGGTTLIPGDFTAILDNLTGKPTKKPKLGRKKKKKAQQLATQTETPDVVSRSKRQFVPWNLGTTRSNRSSSSFESSQNRGTSPAITFSSVITPSTSSSSSTTSTTEAPDEDYTQPDWSKYPVVSGEVEPVDHQSGEGPLIMEGVETTTEDEESEINNAITPMVDGTGGVLIIGGNGNRKYWITKQTTRGDIPSELDEEITTSTTTEMTSTSSTTMAPTTMEPTPDSLERFLTNVMTMVTLIFTHNSTKTDEIDLSRIRDFSKWITTLESVVETKKVTQAYLNSTFGTTVKVNVDEKEIKTCYVTVCEDGTTVPKDIKEFFNCTDIYCTMEKMLGPRMDNCWIPRSRMCITTTAPAPTMDPDISIRLRKLCWETMFGQEIVKLTVMDLIITVVFILVLDFIRAILVRILNPCWCWDLEKTFPQYGDFKIAENILHLVNNQGMIWMGMFFSPGLPTLNLVKLVILLYIRSWAVMTCNVPHETVFRASRSNNFYFALLLFMLFLCTLPVAYAVVWLEPSWHCGPFSEYERIYHILTQAILGALPVSTHKVLDYIASPGIVIPLLLLLVLIIYYLLSLTNSLREANNDLKIQLRRERTEERRKMFKLAGGKKKDETPMAKWAMLIPMAAKDKDPSKGSSIGRGGGEGGGSSQEKRSSILTTGKMTGFAGAAKRAALKARQQDGDETTKKEQRPSSGGDDDGNATDVDQASLPEDQQQAHTPTITPAVTSGTKQSVAAKSQPKPPVAARKPSCTDSVTSRSEIPVIKISEEVDSGGKVTTITSQPISTGATLPSPSSSIPEGAQSPSIEPEKRKRVMKALIKASKEQGTSLDEPSSKSTTTVVPKSAEKQAEVKSAKTGEQSGKK